LETDNYIYPAIKRIGIATNNHIIEKYEKYRVSIPLLIEFNKPKRTLQAKDMCISPGDINISLKDMIMSLKDMVISFTLKDSKIVYTGRSATFYIHYYGLLY
jgi:hypothetical protein